MQDKNNIERFNEIMAEIKELAHEAYRMIPNGIEKERARSYWFPHILGAVDTDNDYLGGSMFTMQNTYDALIGCFDEDDETEEDDDEQKEVL